MLQEFPTVCGVHDVVSWGAIFFGQVKCGQGQKALEEGGVETDPVTFVGLLNACASVTTLERRQVS
jgi:hypothetical protein